MTSFFSGDVLHCEDGGKLALLCHIVRSGEAVAIDGVFLTSPAAALIMTLYERLAPHNQELFAMECNYGFWASTWKWLGQKLAREIAEHLQV